MAEHWRLKPEALGSIPGGTTFLSFPLPFQMYTDSNGPDNLYRFSDLDEPRLSGSLCCDEAQILLKSQTQQLSPINNNIMLSFCFWGAKGAPILFSEIGFCMASCSYIYIYVCIYISVKMAAPWGSLTLLSYYSLCLHLHSH